MCKKESKHSRAEWYGMERTQWMDSGVTSSSSRKLRKGKGGYVWCDIIGRTDENFPCIMCSQRWIVKRTINQSGFLTQLGGSLTAHIECSIFHLETNSNSSLSFFLMLYMTKPCSIFVCHPPILFFLYDRLIEINDFFNWYRKKGS